MWGHISILYQYYTILDSLCIICQVVLNHSHSCDVLRRLLQVTEGSHYLTKDMLSICMVIELLRMLYFYWEICVV